MVPTQNILPDTRRYAFRRIVATSEKRPADQKLSYLYIGSEIIGAQKLHSGFELSYFVHSYTEAFNLLNRLGKAKNLPSLILVDGVAEVSGISDLRVFNKKLQESEQLGSINVLVEVAGCRDTIIAQLAKEKGITDLVKIDNPDTLSRKAAFYTSLETNAELLGSQVQAGTNWKLIAKYAPVRVFDVVFSSICMFLLSPLFLLIAVMVRLDGGNNIFEYNMERGLRYRSFRYIRFRTELSFENKTVADLCNLNQFSVAGQDQSGYQHKPGGTSRIGSILQRTNLDELPALFNILTGDMSFLKSR